MTEDSEAGNWQGEHGREFVLGRKESTIAARWNIMSARPGASSSAPRVNFSNHCVHSPLTCQITFSSFAVFFFSFLANRRMKVLDSKGFRISLPTLSLPAVFKHPPWFRWGFELWNDKSKSTSSGKTFQ